MADTNRYLTKALVILNMVYVDLFREYRILWFVGTNSNSGNITNYGDVEKKIKDNLKIVDFLFDKFNHAAMEVVTLFLPSLTWERQPLF